jgi:hypothetical protein
MTIPGYQWQGAGTQINSITFDLPVSDDSAIIVAGNTQGTITNITSNNTVWSRLIGPTPNVGWFDVWLGIVSTGGWQTLNLVHAAGFCTATALELPGEGPNLTGAIGQTLEQTFPVGGTTYQLAGCTPGNIVVATCGHGNTLVTGILRNMSPKGVGGQGEVPNTVTVPPPNFCNIEPLLACTVGASGIVTVDNLRGVSMLQMVELVVA